LGTIAPPQTGPFPAALAATPAQPAVFQGPTTNPAAAGATTSPFVAPVGGNNAATLSNGANAAGGTLTGTVFGNPAANSVLSGGSNVSTGANFLAAGQVGNSLGSSLNPTGANLIAVAPPSTTGLGQASGSSSSAVVVVQPQGTNVSPATLSPESLPLSSSAPLNVLDPANYLLARGLNASLHAGNIPSLLVTQTTETVLEAGGNSGGGGLNTPGTGNGGVLPIDSGPLPDAQPVPPQVLDALRFLSSARPAASDADTALSEWQEVPHAEALAVVASADAEW
jgi:hypothetical protein